MTDTDPATIAFTATVHIDGRLSLTDVHVSAVVREPIFVGELRSWSGTLRAVCQPDYGVELQVTLLAGDVALTGEHGRYLVRVSHVGVLMASGERAEVTADFDGVGPGPTKEGKR